GPKKSVPFVFLISLRGQDGTTEGQARGGNMAARRGAGTSATAPMQTCQLITPACGARHRVRFSDHSLRLTHESRLSNLAGTKLDRGYLTTQLVALSRRRVAHWTDG